MDHQAKSGLRLPLQSPPVSRSLPGRQGHQHPGGLEAAQCAGAVGHGFCHYPNGYVDASSDCEYCCRNGGIRWVSRVNNATRWCVAPPPALPANFAYPAASAAPAA